MTKLPLILPGLLDRARRAGNLGDVAGPRVPLDAALAVSVS
ncbi:MAG: hypothetical protein ACYC3X_27370 [Pirellulaceae bacterium]